MRDIESRSPFSSQTKLSPNQKILIGIVGLSSMLEFWDAYLIGFIMSFLVKPWGLSYGVLGTVLLASGLGAMLGGIAWGALADRYGRKPVFISSIALTALSSLALAFTPERDWLYMAVLRVIMGFGTGGFFIQIGWIQEFVPPRRRGVLTGIVSAITTGGLLLGGLSGAFIVPAIGWRETFALGALPGLIAVAAIFIVPESPRWLLLQGREAAARRAIAWARGCRVEEVVDLGPAIVAPRRSSWFELFSYPRNLASTFLINLGLLAGYYGIVLWSPTLFEQVQGITAAEASKIMIGFSLCGFFARLVAAYCADAIGRRYTGGFFAFGAAVFTLVAGFVGAGHLFSPNFFWIPVLLAFIFADGSFSVCALYSTEIWPSRLRGAGAGIGGLSGSLGKILGPLGLALVAGSQSVIMPKATAAAVGPAFTFLAACLLVCALAYLLIGIEGRNRSLEEIDATMEMSPSRHKREG